MLVGNYQIGVGAQKFMFVAKYTPAYAFLWIKTFSQAGATSKIIPLDADIVSSAGDIVVVGFTHDVFPGSGLTPGSLTHTGFLLHLAANGTTLWISQDTTMDSPIGQVVCRDSSVCYLQSNLGNAGVLKSINIGTKAIGLNFTFTSSLLGNGASLFLSPGVSNQGVGMAYVYTPSGTQSQLFVNFYHDDGSMTLLGDSISLGIYNGLTESAAVLEEVLYDSNDNLYVVGYTKFNFKMTQPVSHFQTKKHATPPKLTTITPP